MNTFGVFPLRPITDNKSLEELKKDFRAGKDFITASGKRCSIRDFKPGTLVSFRYSNGRKAASFTV